MSEFLDDNLELIIQFEVGQSPLGRSRRNRILLYLGQAYIQADTHIYIYILESACALRTHLILLLRRAVCSSPPFYFLFIIFNGELSDCNQYPFF